jgi:hypothetical protein
MNDQKVQLRPFGLVLYGGVGTTTHVIMKTADQPESCL